MFVDGKQQQGRRPPLEIGQVRAFEGRVRRKGLGIGKIEAERKAALEPGFDGVTIGRDHLRCRAAGESAEVLIEQFCRKVVGLTYLPPTHERHRQQEGRSQANPRHAANGVNAGSRRRLLMKLSGEPGKNIRRWCKAAPGTRSGRLQLRSRKNAKCARMAAGYM